MPEHDIKDAFVRHLIACAQHHAGDDAPWHLRVEHENYQASCLFNCRQTALVEALSDPSTALGNLIAAQPRALSMWGKLKADWERGEYKHQRLPPATDRQVLPAGTFEQAVSFVISTAAEAEADQQVAVAFPDGPDEETTEDEIDDVRDGIIGEVYARVLPCLVACMRPEDVAQTLLVDNNGLRQAVQEQSDFDGGEQALQGLIDGLSSYASATRSPGIQPG